jgi:hypothetical protein
MGIRGKKEKSERTIMKNKCFAQNVKPKLVATRFLRRI